VWQGIKALLPEYITNSLHPADEQLINIDIIIRDKEEVSLQDNKFTGWYL
jgi:hypothetical protein